MHACTDIHTVHVQTPVGFINDAFHDIFIQKPQVLMSEPQKELAQLADGMGEEKEVSSAWPVNSCQGREVCDRVAPDVYNIVLSIAGKVKAVDACTYMYSYIITFCTYIMYIHVYIPTCTTAWVSMSVGATSCK